MDKMRFETVNGTDKNVDDIAEIFSQIATKFKGKSNRIACYDANVPELVIREIAKRKPLRAGLRDSSFASSPEKINVEAIFKCLSLITQATVT